jgi:hypothetical protein
VSEPVWVGKIRRNLIRPRLGSGGQLCENTWVALGPRSAQPIHQVVPCEPASSPHRVSTDDGIGIGERPPESPYHPRVASVTHVSQSEQRVPPEIARLAPWHVPAAKSVEQLLVGGIQQIENVDQRLIAGPSEGRWVLPVHPAVHGACQLAVVAPVDPSAESDTVLTGKRSGRFEEPGEASSGVEYARGAERARRTRRHAADT